MSETNKRAVIVGATSGIGYEVAKLLVSEGWRIGIAGRREEKLKMLQSLSPDRICYRVLDVRQPEAEQALRNLIDDLGGMDLYFHSSGIGHQNFSLNPDIELDTVETNAAGFVRLTTAAFRYFCQQPKGHIAVISSIAGTKPPNGFKTSTSMRWNNRHVCTTPTSVLPTSAPASLLPDY